MSLTTIKSEPFHMIILPIAAIKKVNEYSRKEGAMKKTFIILLLSCLGSFAAQAAPLVDLIIFSYNRPLQLYALLESVSEHVSGLRCVTVIYRADGAYQDGYDDLKNIFVDVDFVMQKNPPADFKELTVEAVRGAGDYLMFAVDDQVVKDNVDVSYCAQLIEEHNAYGFFLRLGDHVDYCYSMRGAQGIPPLEQVAPFVYRWQFCTGKHDWNYPHTVDATIYRTRDVLPFIEQLSYSGPNTLEGYWAGSGSGVGHHYGLCFANTKTVNLPLNRVQNVYKNRAMEDYEASELLAVFVAGLKMDSAPLANIANRSAHMEYHPTFITRDTTKQISVINCPRLAPAEEVFTQSLAAA